MELTETLTDGPAYPNPREELFRLRREAALNIDPKTAEVMWIWGQILDPYGEMTDFPEEWHCIGRLWFSRAPGSDIWVCYYDLPQEVVLQLEKRPYLDDFPDGFCF